MTTRSSHPSALTWGIVHPGAMGASVAAALKSTGAAVLWCFEGRSRASVERADSVGLVGVDSLTQLAENVDAIISVCPPAMAVSVATAIAEVGFDGLYVDANAIAPATAIEVAQLITTAGASFVDGGIVGPPADAPGTTRLYLSGEDAERVVDAFAGSALEAIVVNHEIGAASALKVAYAAWTKASAALLLNVRAFAEAEGVTEALLAEWERSQPGTKERSELTVAHVAPKAWRFAGEMNELAAGFSAAGLPDGALTAAAEIFARLEGHKDAEGVDLEGMIDGLLGRNE